MTSSKTRSAVIDWEKLKQHGVHPSFSLPSSYHAVRAHVPPASIREVCDKHPRHEFNHLCDREAVVIPLLLARPEGTNLDTQVYRAHVQNSRRYLGTSGTFTFDSEKLKDATDLTDKTQVEVSKEDIGTSTSKAIDATDFLAKEISLDSTAVEALLSAAANRPVSGSTTWSTPLPQSSADGAVHLVGAEVESMATTDCLEQALIKPRRVKRWQPRLSTAKTRARFERLAQKLGSL